MSMDGHNTLTKRGVRVREPSKNKTKKNMKTRQNKIMGYLAVTAGVGCASSVANAGVVFYGNASNTNIQADPNGLNFNSFAFPAEFGGGGRRIISSDNLFFGYESGGSGFLTRGVDMFPTQYVEDQFSYHNFSIFWQGGVAGDQNYANISFNGADSVYEAVAQFYLDGSGGGYLMAIATLNEITNPQDLSTVGGLGLGIAAGKAMIDAAAVSAVPEPSSHLALLALGAGGLTLRRRLKRAA